MDRFVVGARHASPLPPLRFDFHPHAFFTALENRLAQGQLFVSIFKGRVQWLARAFAFFDVGIDGPVQLLEGVWEAFGVTGWVNLCTRFLWGAFDSRHASGFDSLGCVHQSRVLRDARHSRQSLFSIRQFPTRAGSCGPL